MYIQSKIKLLSVIIIVFLSACILSAFSLNKGENSDTEVSLPIIMYHSILKDSKLQNDYTISPSLFEEDLKYLTSNGYTTITVDDLLNYVYSNKPLPPKPIMLTFDDGYYNNYYYAYPLLKKYNCKAVISPIIKMTEYYTKSNSVSVTYGHINVDNIKEMINSGVIEIQNHSYDMHKLKPRRGVEQKSGETEDEYVKVITDDILKAQNFLKENLNINPQCFIYPFGAKNDLTLKTVKKLGFLCTLTCTEEPNLITKNPDSLYDLGRYRRDRKESMSNLISRINIKANKNNSK